ncbi:hypothetical protein EVA_18348 [gut metagenome]|uniref:Uncharacterized protein n=1 Tax=gut metagenome TaxID=749906 RepID=J9FF89_9ZZZZ
MFAVPSVGMTFYGSRVCRPQCLDLLLRVPSESSPVLNLLLRLPCEISQVFRPSFTT